MTKKEQAEMDALKRAFAEARALSWPSYGEQQRMDRPATYGVTPTPGWYAHFGCSMYERVSLGCFTTSAHSPEGTKTTTQGPGRFYVSKVAALRQVRWEATQKFAAILASLDARIKEAETE